MKCYKNLAIIFIVAIVSNLGFAQTEAEVLKNIEIIEKMSMVIPYEADEIESGELYKVKVVSVKNFDKLVTYKNQRINEIMFVTEVIDNRPDGFLFEVFVTTPPKDKKAKEYSFKYEGFKYKNDKKDLQGDLVTLAVSNPFDFSNLKFDMKYKVAIIVIFLLLTYLMFIICRKIYRHRKRKKLFSRRAKELIGLIKNAKSKEDYERIYREKKEISKYVALDEKKFIKLLSKINDYQFRASWNEAYSLEIQEVSKNLDIKGVNRGI